jgi:hypothetical protein
MTHSILKQIATTVVVFTALTTTAFAQEKDDKAALVKQIKELTAANAEVAKHLETFDTLDFTVFRHACTRAMQKILKYTFLMATPKLD